MPRPDARVVVSPQGDPATAAPALEVTDAELKRGIHDALAKSPPPTHDPRPPTHDPRPTTLDSRPSTHRHLRS